MDGASRSLDIELLDGPSAFCFGVIQSRLGRDTVLTSVPRNALELFELIACCPMLLVDALLSMVCPSRSSLGRL